MYRNGTASLFQNVQNKREAAKSMLVTKAEHHQRFWISLPSKDLEMLIAFYIIEKVNP